MLVTASGADELGGEPVAALSEAMNEPWLNFADAMGKVTEDAAKGLLEGLKEGVAEGIGGIGEGLGKLKGETAKGFEEFGLGFNRMTEYSVKEVAEGIGGIGEGLDKLKGETAKGIEEFGLGFNRLTEDSVKSLDKLKGETASRLEEISRLIQEALPASPLASTTSPLRNGRTPRPSKDGDSPSPETWPSDASVARVRPAVAFALPPGLGAAMISLSDVSDLREALTSPPEPAPAPADAAMEAAGHTEEARSRSPPLADRLAREQIRWLREGAAAARGEAEQLRTQYEELQEQLVQLTLGGARESGAPAPAESSSHASNHVLWL